MLRKLWPCFFYAQILVKISASFDYCKIRPDHVLCPLNSEFGPACGPPELVDLARLSDAEKEEIVIAHNEFRDKVARGDEKRGLSDIGQPPASNMLELYWDDELAKAAESSARKCLLRFSCAQCLKLQRFQAREQLFRRDASKRKNLEVSWPYVVEKFFLRDLEEFNQSYVMNYRSMKRQNAYANMVEANIKSVGCAKLTFKNLSMFSLLAICTYGPAELRPYPLYHVGQPCTMCPHLTKCSSKFPNLCAEEILHGRSAFVVDEETNLESNDTVEISITTEKIDYESTIIPYDSSMKDILVNDAVAHANFTDGVSHFFSKTTTEYFEDNDDPHVQKFNHSETTNETSSTINPNTHTGYVMNATEQTTVSEIMGDEISTNSHENENHIFIEYKENINKLNTTSFSFTHTSRTEGITNDTSVTTPSTLNMLEYINNAESSDVINANTVALKQNLSSTPKNIISEVDSSTTENVPDYEYIIDIVPTYSSEPLPSYSTVQYSHVTSKKPACPNQTISPMILSTEGASEESSIEDVDTTTSSYIHLNIEQYLVSGNDTSKASPTVFQYHIFVYAIQLALNVCIY